MKRAAVLLIILLCAASPAFGSAKKGLRPFFVFHARYLDKGTSEQRRLALLNVATYLQHYQYRLDPAPLNKVLSALSDRDPGVREAAAASLKLLGLYSKGCCREEAEIVPRLITALDDLSPRVRDEAAKALGYYKDPRAAATLIRRLKDGDRMVRLNAAYALGRIRVAPGLIPALLGVLKGGGGPKERIVEQEVIIALRNASTANRYSHRAQAVPVLLEKAQDRHLRLEAIKALGNYSAEEARGLFEEALREGSDDKIRKHAAYGLSRLRKGRDIELDLEPFEKALKSPNHSERMKAVKALGDLRNRSAVEPLITATRDESHYVRKEAVKALARHNDERLLATFAGLLFSKRYYVGSEASKAFKSLAGRTAQRYVSGKGFRLYVHPAAVASLLGVLEQEDPGMSRIYVLELLALFDDERVDGVLKRYIDDPVPEVRARVVSALGTRGAGRIGVVLDRLVNDEDLKVRAAAAATLKHFEDERTREALTNVIEDNEEDGYVRSAALHAISRFKGPEVAALVVRMIDDEADDPRRAAMLIIQKRPRRFRGVEGLAEALIRRLSMDELGMPVNAMRTLGKLKEPKAAEPIIRVLKGSLKTGKKENDTHLRREAAYSLFLLGDERAAPPLIEILWKKEEDFYLRIAAAKALVEIGDPAAIAPLESFLKETFAAVHKKKIRKGLYRLKSAKSGATGGRPGR